MQQSLHPFYQLNLQGLAKLWLSIRHRTPPSVVEQTREHRHRSLPHKALAQLSQSVQDVDRARQNRQSLYALIQGALEANTTWNEPDELEPMLDDMLADHLTTLSLHLEKAKEVQQRFLPQVLPEVNGVDLFAVLRPATELSGDFYDFIEADGRQDAFFFTVGDVSSKGMSAALLMPVLCKVLRTAIRFLSQPTPQALLTFVHEDMYAQLNSAAMFASMFVGRYESATRQIVYANAGHSPVIYKPHGGPAQLLRADGTPVGLLQQSSWNNHTLTLAPGDLLLIGTDGIVDTRNQMRNLFGYDRLLTTVDQLAGDTARAIGQELLSVLHEFAPHQLREDDQALLVFKGV
ncbi:MAG: PP2C family protein-serine/threonine phosphatase [Caldilineaceae bacterium]|nr:PP2C family protein-serine/threonine phosphatase [Caldilineaceae bacterium]